MRTRVHLICNAHLDPVWQWQWEEGVAETLSTFRNAVEILNEHDTLIFTHNEAVLYDWVRKYDPSLFKEIQKLVKKGRWSVSGGWWLQPDVNMPGTESLIRHIYEGRKFFKKYFNAEPLTAYNFDSFGHSGGLPQLLVKSGYKMYIHMRPQKPDLDLPSDIYRWQGVDGSTIGALRIEVGLYHTEYDNIGQRIEEGVALALKLNRDVPVFWGIGDHGGGATRADLKTIDDIIANEKRVEIIHSSPDLIYKSLKKHLANAPIIKGDLQKVFTGCYTSLSRIKRANQKSLGMLTQSESLAAAAWLKFNSSYPADELESIWQDHLFNEFHDILPGSCVEPAEKDALDLYGKIETELRKINIKTAVSFNRGEKIRKYIPVTVMNSNPALKNVPVEVECMISHRPKWVGEWHLRLFDMDGKEIECQEEQSEALLPFNGWRRKVSFIAELPAVGIRHYNIEVEEGKKKNRKNNSDTSLSIEENSGLINKLIYKDKNLLTGRLFNPLVIEDKGDSWGSDVWEYRHILGEFTHLYDHFNIKEDGIVRRITESVFSYGKSQIFSNIINYSKWDVLEIRMRINWNEEQTRLKLSIPTIFNEESLLCEVPGGMIERPADGQEHVHGRWFIAGNKNKALAVINNGQYGLDYKDGEIRLSVLRSSAYCHEKGFRLKENGEYKFSDTGIHNIRLLVITGTKEELLERVTALADYISAPPVVYSHLQFGTSDNNYELLSLPPKIRMLVMKQSLDLKAIILRIQEVSGNRHKEKILFDGRQIKLSFKPLEIKTIRIERGGKWREADMIWEK